MDIRSFFESPAAALPKSRTENDFIRYITTCSDDYCNAIGQLDPNCPLGSRILASQPLVRGVCTAVNEVIRQYLHGQPERAYHVLNAELLRLNGLGNLVTEVIPVDAIGPLYRMSRLKPRELSKGRLFHIPLNLRHLVGRHRYGIPGFPCLYLGGCLRVCQLELEEPDDQLHRLGVAEFRLIHSVRMLDFGYRPSLIGRLAAGRVLRGATPNPDLDDFIVNYAICWPIIAASSIRRMHKGNFAAEYIVPQLLLQWVMQAGLCDGIRYSSSHSPADSTDIHVWANYVFPALPPPDTGHSQRVRALCEMTEPCMWQGFTFWKRLRMKLLPRSKQHILGQTFERNRIHLASLPKAQLP